MAESGADTQTAATAGQLLPSAVPSEKQKYRNASLLFMPFQSHNT
jgi:hypothetical protein